MTSSPSLAIAPYHPFAVRVAAVEPLSPHFVRVTFEGDDLANFGSAGPDQRIKVLLPHADGGFADLGQHDASGEWYETWRSLPASERNPFRTYTVRDHLPEHDRVVVDFVMHHDAGPAGEWASGAAVGHEVLLVGADLRAGDALGGSDWHPGPARRILLAGDETAVPAILGILESLGADHEVDAFLEVPTGADILEVASVATMRLQWLARDSRPHGELLTDAVARWCAGSTSLLSAAAAPRRQELDDIDVDRELLWDSPEGNDGDFYAWIAGEASMVKGLRRMLVTAHGVDRKRVAFMGYWRLGQSERTE